MQIKSLEYERITLNKNFIWEKIKKIDKKWSEMTEEEMQIAIYLNNILKDLNNYEKRLLEIKKEEGEKKENDNTIN